jgi:hypothetical protein
LVAGISSPAANKINFLASKISRLTYNWGVLMNTDTILIDVYDRYGKKLIEGITPLNPTNQTIPIFKNYKDT